MRKGKPTALGMAKCIIRKSKETAGHGYNLVEIEMAQAVIDLSAENTRLKERLEALQTTIDDVY